MGPPDPPDIPSSFDPAIFLHSDIPDPLPFSSHTDELEALHEQAHETTAAKTRQGIVIQHRAWRVPDAFRSDEDHQPETPIRKRHATQPISFSIAATSSPCAPPSSPPLTAMPFLSSPPSYPPSAGATDSPRKRRKIDGHGTVLGKDNTSTSRLFQDESGDEDDFAAFDAAHNKRKAVALGAPGSPLEQAPHSVPNEDAAPETELPLSQPMILSRAREKTMFTVRTCSGEGFNVATRRPTPAISYEQLIASRSNAEPGRARKNYYGIDIHALMDEANQAAEEEKLRREGMELDVPMQTVENPLAGRSNKRSLLWSEKYRARKFTDLVGDERTHRLVLKWLKAWDPIVFPGSSRPRQKSARSFDQAGTENEYAHRKILLLTGPPGLGKTTLAHVCARQAGYEVQEINASDERSKDIVRGRIKDMVGTENVRGLESHTATGAKVRKAGKPVCVVVDEVDGVVGGGAGGEGGFIKALIDLVSLDQRNTAPKDNSSTRPMRKKGDKFRLLRPLILICNDVYHPSLRPLRQASIAEIVHIRKPPVNMVVPRLHSIFEKEGISADSDGVRRLCEATWGISSRKDGGGGGTGEGDVRGVMVVGEWVARKLLAETNGGGRLTRKWIEDNVLNGLSQGGGGSRGLGRGGAKEIVERVFKDGAGFPKSAAAAQAEATNIEGNRPIGVAEASKRFAMERLREMVGTAGDTDRIVTDCFTTFANQPFQDDTLLSKPNRAYEWLHFHDSISNLVHTGQEWELAKYLSVPVLAFHDLFASSIRPSLGNQSTFRKGRGAAENGVEPETEPTPFSGPSAPYQAIEQTRANLASLTGLQSSLTLPLTRLYRSPAEVSTELIPYTLRMLSPDVKPVIINTSTAAAGGDRSKPSATASVRKASEKALVMRAVNAMAAVGVRFEKSRIDWGMDARQAGHGGWIFRMEPPLDALGRYETMSSEGRQDEKVRYAVRQIMDVEFRKESLRLEAEARKRRGGAVELEAAAVGEDVEVRNVAAALEKIVVKKDFFGRTVAEAVPLTPVEIEKRRKEREEKGADEDVWVSFHEGFSKAVRKPITLSELLGGL
ncbi:chromosome transmission fidelity protein 18 [Diplodia corticola]|uniref:Chromosome transmission fidelity protein 18 n=1 Tax=Diplodia corticola TaxID=236234 RepID=A0A1J9QKD4_9PEZI|nr:chromosome transmission fidelity protein 18 [Diplodia corticola]OJD29326.1 chromosome transmission fidelity protein 18 [Diplodia corticola]